MKNRIIVHIECAPYLKEFIIALYGQEPVFFPKSDKTNELIAFLVRKPPFDYKPVNADSGLQVILPYFEHININAYNYLSESAQKTLEQRFYAMFWTAWDEYVLRSLQHGSENKSIIIKNFMEKYELSYDPFLEENLRKSMYRRSRIRHKLPKRAYVKKRDKKHQDS